jgi:hypothetical protein
MVNEKIFKYLLESGKGVGAAQILSHVLNIRSPNAEASESVLAGFLRQDSRFVFADGLWHLSSLEEPARFDPGRTVVLHLQSANGPEGLQNVRGGLVWADGRLHEFRVPASANIPGGVRAGMEGHLLIVWSSRELRLWNALLRSQARDRWEGTTLYLRNLAARALNRTPSSLRQPEELAWELGLSPVDEDRPGEAAQYLRACWSLLLDRVPTESRRSFDSLREWINGPAAEVDFSRFAFEPDFLHRLPSAPGVYILKDSTGTIVYVGKSRNLKRRVASYFTPNALSYPKIARIHRQLHSIDLCRTDNEIEALLLEMRMIRDFRPAINLQAEIHARRADRHQGRNVLLFAVNHEQKQARIYFLRDGIFTGRYSAALGRPPSKRLREKVKSGFFSRRRSRKKDSEAWEKEIVSRWFAVNRKRLNYLDIDDAGNLGSALDRLRDYLCDPDRLTRKVYYR